MVTHRAKLCYESRFVLLSTSRLSGIWAWKGYLFIYVGRHRIIKRKKQKTKPLGKERTIKGSAPDYTL